MAPDHRSRNCSRLSNAAILFILSILFPLLFAILAAMEITGRVFKHSGEYGDFAWMIEQPEYADALFIFNDNEEQFLAYRSDPISNVNFALAVDD
ncbi:MAG: hypothetical protein DWQ47_11405 [Acidobacteria bacterium]|nr:MAG: hypothetical protein DWQ32_13820 [Acidobacteriota bacterium]REJ98184.1 MAG: hypothetical protein DWQ38_16620 [Acidobacteriota bacterium]REK16927.1 MAG: hypothetical protein DWQ43_01665 [Acidobacteriota bacterium]REK42838.1 MAG: hypothetical protein DWQ47_11405 [Acidobacteriota bacterium]